MKKKMVYFILLMSFTFLSVNACAEEMNGVQLSKAKINLHDKASLQRGAKYFMNYCSGCHSLKYMRFNRMAQDLGIVDRQGEIATDLLKNNLIFTDSSIYDTLLIAMPPADAKTWFGIIPPDLSLISRVRGADWLYTYLKSFYQDPSRPWGVNNAVFADVAMPNVLEALQGIQAPYYQVQQVTINGQSQENKVLNHLYLVKDGTMNQREFDELVRDTVNFLVYVGEPVQLIRVKLGIWVLTFLAILLIFAYLLKKEYWKDIH